MTAPSGCTPGERVDLHTSPHQRPPGPSHGPSALARATRAALVLLLSVSALAVAAWVSAWPAAAHINLVRSFPSDGATVTTAPGRVTLAFDENVRRPAVVVVTAPGGRRVSRGETHVVDNTATTDVSLRGPGVYTIGFRVLSADGHPATDRTTFAYQPAGAAGEAQAATRPARTGDPPGSAGPVADVLAGGTAILALLVGVALLGVRRRGSRRHAADTQGAG